MKQSLQLRIGHNLTMTPQLQQAIKLLQLSSLELQTEIQQTLDANPLLDQEDNFGEITVFDFDNEDSTDFKPSDGKFSENRAEQALPDELAIDASWENIYDNQASTATPSTNPVADNHDMFENQAGEEDVLRQHLIWQLDHRLHRR
jgi:RNA polymerase sigma-54 factor